MDKIKSVKMARKIAYNIFERTGNIYDYAKYKGLDDMVKSYEKQLEDNQFGMQ